MRVRVDRINVKKKKFTNSNEQNKCIQKMKMIRPILEVPRLTYYKLLKKNYNGI
jgi:hypothetical protein